jgi:hypothetical protein
MPAFGHSAIVDQSNKNTPASADRFPFRNLIAFFNF